MEHGGDVLSYKDFYKGEIIDFSSNINPLGLPLGLKEKILEGVKDINRYPDIKYRHLKSQISKYLRCPRENVVVGNGAMDIINNFTVLFPRIITFIPSFSEYEKRALANGKDIVRLGYNKDFTINTQALNENIKEGDLVILGNPNNPTGLRIHRESLMEIYQLVKNKGAYLLLDEAFYEFTPRDYDSIEIFKAYGFHSVGIIRAATKFFALPGLRLGYGCISKDMIDKYSQVEMPWSVNTFADLAGQYIFKDKGYIKESQAYIERERKFLLENLKALDGIHPYNTHTNYILIKLLKWKEDFVFRFFLKRGILLRKCSNFPGLEGEFIRIAIRTREDNEKILKVFRELEELQ